MDVRVKVTSDLPALGLWQVEVHLRVQRGINHDGLVALANEIGEASFSGAPHLDDTSTTLLHRYLSGIPGQTPRLHATFKGKRLYPSHYQLLSGDLAGFACCTHRHNRSIFRQFDGRQGLWITCFECIVGVSMQASRNRPLHMLSGG